MAGNSLCRSEPAAFASESRAGAALPLLPTLLVAAVVGTLALCREPAPMASAPAQEPAAQAVASHQAAEPITIGPYQVGLDGSGRLGATSPISGSLAFARQFPVIVAGPTDRAAPTRVARTAHPRPGCPGTRCGETTGALATASPRAAEQLRAGTPPAVAFEAEREPSVLPDLALPFAPTLRVVRQAVGIVGHQATAARTDALALCDAVADLVGGLR